MKANDGTEMQGDARAVWRGCNSINRGLERIAAGLPINQTAQFPALVELQAQIAIDTAPALAKSRRWDAFIASGVSTFRDFLKLNDEDTQAKSPAPVRLALPIGLPMPPNICTNPAFNV